MHCPDQKGIIAAVTNFIHSRNGNITYIDQYVDRNLRCFFYACSHRIYEYSIDFIHLKVILVKEFSSSLNLKCHFYLEDKLPKLGVFVSKYDHCLYDILSQQRSGKLKCEIPFILSNHIDLEFIATQFDIPFYHVPITKETKQEAEIEQLRILTKHKIDCIVLARYMQIVSKNLIDVYPSKIINIHHSFLPAFPGAKPYHSAFDEGVKSLAQLATMLQKL